MIQSWVPHDRGLASLPAGAPLDEARWIDLYDPTPAEIESVDRLGFDVPTLEDMEEIEISNRLYRQGDTDYMTAVIVGQVDGGGTRSMPVTFILAPDRLVTVRHHRPRPFETFPCRAEFSAAGTGSADRIFLGLIEEVIARFADILEGAGRVVDDTTAQVFGGQTDTGPALRDALTGMGKQADIMARLRMAMLSTERVLSFYQSTIDEDREESTRLRSLARALNRDIQALEVHADFLAGRVGLAVDATLGLINLEQNNTVRVLSLVAALFLPPTVIASIFGMNFDHMPELHWQYGYPLALGLMVASAWFIWWLAKRKKWR